MTEPQRKFFNDQDILSLDISALYKNFIREIDFQRSNFNAIDSNLAQSISIDKIDSLFINTNINTVGYQESRCHTFYRMIGLPVVADETQFYSPGFDPTLNINADDFNKNIQIANITLKKLRSMFDKREERAKNSANTFNKQDINATALSMSSMFVRKFEDQFKDGVEPLNLDKQTFNVDDRKTISEFFADKTLTVKLSESIHILKPFVVDPRFDFTIIPAKNRICAPFLGNKVNTKLTDKIQLKRPYLEKVITTKLNNQNVNDSNTDDIVNNILDTIQENTNIIDSDLVEFSKSKLSILTKSEILIVDKYFKIMRAMATELINSINIIRRMRNQINWQPIPDTKGPEFGLTLQTVDRNDTNRNKQIEIDIATLTIKKTLDQFEFNIGTTDVSDFSFSGIDDIVFGSFKNVEKMYDQQLNSLNRKREEFGNTANKALQNIEIITGEFSGLGLLDIMAIQITLWSLPVEVLAGLIDERAFVRLQSDNSLKSDALSNSRVSIMEALVQFEKKISEVYKLMQKFVDNLENKPQ